MLVQCAVAQFFEITTDVFQSCWFLCLIINEDYQLSTYEIEKKRGLLEILVCLANDPIQRPLYGDSRSALAVPHIGQQAV
jgi:hypothetical protein